MKRSGQNLIVRALAVLSVVVCLTSCRRERAAVFLSDTDPMYRELEQRQGLLLASISFHTPQYQGTEQIKSLLNHFYRENSFEFSGAGSHAEQIKHALEGKLLRPFPTRHENPEYYVLLVWGSVLIEDVLSRNDPKSDLQLTRPPLLGTIPSNHLDASTIQSPGSPIGLVAVDWGVFEVVMAMTELAVHTVSIDLSSDGKSFNINGYEEQFQRRLPELKGELINLLSYYYANGNPAPRTAAGPYAALESESRAIEVFVLAHEYGHLLAGHKASTVESTKGQNSKTLVHSWAQELEADMIGYELLSYVMREAANEVPRQNTLLAYHMMAPMLYFEFVRIVDEAEYIVQHKELPSQPDPREVMEAKRTLELALQEVETGRWDEPRVVTAFSHYSDHPPAWLRWSLAQMYFEGRLPALQRNGQAQFAGISVAMDLNIHKLWDETAPAFLETVKSMDGPGR